jgi:hypothetical protein
MTDGKNRSSVPQSAPLASPKRVHYLETREINIHQPQTGEHPAEGGLIPNILETRDDRLKIVQAQDPVVRPRKYRQKKADLESE